MKQILQKIMRIALAGTLVFASSASISLSQNIGACMDNRSINAARASGSILPLADILRFANVGANANILNVRVCQINGQDHYLIDVLGANGAAKHLILRATDGTPYIAG
jgi:hypothetical protein